jgi:EAL domain-containing protein (putative c-di-GMP-specific phosphodiesterase class I)/CheY-like chemotaxis protein
MPDPRSLPEEAPPCSAELLVVEDDDRLRSNLSRFLELEGYSVDAAEDGVAAISLLASKEYDLVLTDLNMPNLGGFPLIEAIRSSGRTRSTPILILSAYEQKENLLRAMRRGVQDFLGKPWSPDQLLEAVQRLLTETGTSAEPEVEPASEVGDFCSHARYLRQAATSHGQVYVAFPQCTRTLALLPWKLRDQAMAGMARRFREAFPGASAVGELGNCFFGICFGEKEAEEIEADPLPKLKRAQEILEAPMEMPQGVHLPNASIFYASGKVIRSLAGSSRGAQLSLEAMAQYRLWAEPHSILIGSVDEDDSSGNRIDLPAVLRRALDHAPEEFGVQWQPKVSLADGSLVGSEVLARWQSFELGAVSPVHFVSAAEDWGMALDLGVRLRRAALAEVGMAYAAADPALPLSLNISGHELGSAQFLPGLLRLLDEAGVCPSRVILEVTESAPVLQGTESLQVLQDLRAAGFGISVDDFGTGFSTFSSVRHLPVTELKIDRSFVSDITSSDRSRKLAQTVIELARALELPVVAEGVETQDQADCLRYLGCTIGQGYLWSRPLPAEDFAAWHGEFRSARQA